MKWGARMCVAFLVGHPAACITSGDEPCGPQQTLTDDGVCICNDGFSLSASRQCVADTTDAGAAGVAADGGIAGEVDAATDPSLGRSCSGPDDCGDDAPYCDTHHYQMCLVAGCMLEADDCPSGWECCDLSVFGVQEMLCVRAGECPTR